MEFSRYGIYYTPGDTHFADAGASWLGWDIRTARSLIPPFPDFVARPQKYGFHATLKPPFRLAEGKTETELLSATELLANSLSPVDLGQLTLSQIGSFFAWSCAQRNTALKNFASTIVEDLDIFRAPATDSDINDRIRPGMTDAQIRYIYDWGYPYVMEFFRFHMTLTGPIPKTETARVATLIETYFSDDLPDRLVIDALTVVGERSDGKFSELLRVPAGQSDV